MRNLPARKARRRKKTVDEHKGALEALLFIADNPLPVTQLAAAIGQNEEVTTLLLEELQEEYAQGRPRGFVLRNVGGGWRFYTNPQFGEIVTAHLVEGHSGKLSTAALETLAVIAYQQPVTRAQIAQVRGVSVDGVVKTLATRGFIEPCGETEVTGATLWGTTNYFLEAMGMNSLDELPPLAPYLPARGELDEVEKEIR
ncbi:SMC-Scp complex subunit ScpB [Actinobaculum suis]|nr:SMC-Scp complex subunit ScpB [Actinobaculum suis]OCA94230.1 SMC-Scp complex subunit ScpB [Actinobaculum suis]